MTLSTRPAALLAGTALLTIGACSEPLDYDMRGIFGANAPSTSQAAREATADRPDPDERGVISYPGYQVAVARRGDTVDDLATRVGVEAGTLARYNGLETGDRLRRGEVLALPDRVDEPEGGPIQPPRDDISDLAGAALDEADADRIETTTLDPAQQDGTEEPERQEGVEPVRHMVERGETAYTIARLYDISVRSLAEWNGLDSDFSVRDGQYLLIPVASPGMETESYDGETPDETEQPGTGSATPTPPSASKPLPDEETSPSSEPEETVAAPDLSETQSEPAQDDAAMAYPVRGDIVREYAKGRNEGIDISASPGTPVNAAADGVVAAITEDSNGIPIIVVKHPDNLLTVYSNIADVAVTKGDNVSRGQKMAAIRGEGSSALHFEVRDGFESVDPADYLD